MFLHRQNHPKTQRVITAIKIPARAIPGPQNPCAAIHLTGMKGQASPGCAAGTEARRSWRGGKATTSPTSVAISVIHQARRAARSALRVEYADAERLNAVSIVLRISGAPCSSNT